MSLNFCSNNRLPLEDQASMLTGLLIRRPIVMKLFVRALLTSPDYIQRNYAPNEDVRSLDIEELCSRVSRHLKCLEYSEAQIVVLAFLTQMTPQAREELWYGIYVAGSFNWNWM
jgi:hypothetical protein